jgi:hypothetical protein
MSFSSLLRLGGLAAVLGAVLLVMAGLVQLVLNLFFPGPGAINEVTMTAFYIRSGLELLGRALVMLGLVGLYVRQSEATGILGLAGFLAAFLGMASPVGLGWAAVLTNLGWILFGIASLQARIYPREAAILLVVGTVLSGVFNYLLVTPVVVGPGSPLVYAGVGAEITRNVAVGWLGYALFSARSLASERPST